MNIGERVKFLNDVGGGIITKFIDKETAMILGDDGFEMPVSLKELLTIPNEKKQKPTTIPVTEKPSNLPQVEEEEEEEEAFYTDSSDVSIYLALVPKNNNSPTDSDATLYLINDSNFFLTFNILTRKDEKFLSFPGKIEPNTKEKIKDFPKNSIKEDLEISVQVLFYDKRPHEQHEPVSTTILIRAVKIYKEGSYKENDFFDQRALVLPIIEENAMKEAIKQLTDKDLKKVVVQKEILNETLNTPKHFRKRIEPQIKEVDLHIDELLDNRAGLENNELLQVQMDKFRSEMKAAIQNKIAKIVFIHGVGSGVLKLELRKELQRDYKKYQFQDASFKEYGYGATMVILR